MPRSSFGLFAAFLFSIALLWPAYESMARGGRGGSFSAGRSFSSSSSFGGGHSSSSWSSGLSTSSNRASGWGSSVSRSTGPSSAADSAMGTKVNRAGVTTSRGGLITTRQLAEPEAVPSGAQTQWASEPSTRPSYVPYGATLNDGRYATVYYDPTYHNYGYWDSLGRWMMWDAILNSGSRNYYYGAGPAGYGYSQPYYGRERSSSGFETLLGVLLVGGLMSAGVYFFVIHSGEVQEHYARMTPIYDSYGGAAPRLAPLRASLPIAGPPAALAEWTGFPPGSFITLSDNQSMEDSQKRGEGFTGIRYAVEGSALAEDIEGFGSWAMLTLDDHHQKLLLVVKSVDDQLDYRVYYASDDFRPARREDVIDRGDSWLFEAPENPNDFDPADLRYTAEIVQKTQAGEVTYVRKSQGERQANYTETPVRSGTQELLATIVEYSTSDATENPEVLILEVGAASRRTGEVTLYLGCPIRESEIDVLKASA